MKNIIFLAAVLISGCKLETTSEGRPLEYDCEAAASPAGTEKPDILIMGDSISIGYTPVVRENLASDFDVFHNPCNGRSSTFARGRIDYWLSRHDSLSAVIFNFGLHDMDSDVDTSIEAYKSNLRYIGARIKAKSPVVIFLTSTHVPDNMLRREAFHVDRFNVAAREVMGELQIPVYDLGALSETIVDLHLDPIGKTNIHWSDQGNQIFGDFVTDALINGGI